MMLVVLFICAIYLASGQELFLIDSKSSIFNKQDDFKLKSTETLTSLACGALLIPCTQLRVSHESAEQISSLLSENISTRPQAYLSFQIAGVIKDAEMIYKQLSGERDVQAISIEDSTGWPLAGVADPIYLGQNTAYDCDAECLSSWWSSTVKAKLPGVTLTPDASPGLQIWASELASLHAHSESIAQQLNPKQGVGKLLVVELLGLQALQSHTLAEEDYKQALLVVGLVINDILGTFSSALDGNVAAQVAVLPSQPRSVIQTIVDRVPSNSIITSRSLQQKTQKSKEDKEEEIKEEAKRKKNDHDDGGVDGKTLSKRRGKQAKAFTSTAIGVGVFLILLYATGMTIYIIGGMTFKQDTLLYSREKVE